MDHHNNHHNNQQNYRRTMRSVSVDYTHSGSRAAGFDISAIDVRGWLAQWPRVLTQLDTLVVGLKRRQVSGPFNCAQFTIELYRNIVGSTKWGTAGQLMDAIREVGKELIAAKPSELAVGNMVRRVLFVVREEYESSLEGKNFGSNQGQAQASFPASPSRGNVSPGPSSKASNSNNSNSSNSNSTSNSNSNSNNSNSSNSTSNSNSISTSSSTSSKRSGNEGRSEGIAGGVLAEGSGGLGPSLTGMLGGSLSATDFGRPCPDLRQNVVAMIGELITELRDMRGVIKEHAKDTIHANEVILTFGNSSTVDSFLKAAAGSARDRLNFSVVVAEAAPSCSGHDLAMSLAKHGIDTTVISDSAVFAMMARVNKVILSTHAVVANGGLIALNGSHAVALAAKDLSVPVVCVTGLFKLCPLFAHDQDTFNCLLSPAAVMPFKDKDSMNNVEVLNPAYDYIPPSLVDLYITNMGGLQPSYIYRLLAEYYHRDDLIISPSHEQAA